MANSNTQYLLDTNIVIEYLRHNTVVADKIKSVGVDNCAISVITVHKLYWGVYEAPEKYFISELSKVEIIKKYFDIIPLPENDSYAKTKSSLKKKGEMVDDFDILIAATAMQNNMVVVTDNLCHFERINGISIENWVYRQ
ncbi:MAG: PIN domain-containing protein [Bacteroidaceae bacterium]|nr:PIN domain-containing protein [Bacteroidaceae bacterium]